MEKSFTIKNWVECWTKAEEVMFNLKERELLNCDVSKSIASFDLAFKSAIKNEPLKPYSGLIEQQKIFSRLCHD